MPPTPSLLALRPAILARIAAGEFQKAVCAEQGMPSVGALQLWARQDPAFGAELKTALAQGKQRRQFAFDPVQAEALLDRLRVGETIGKVLADPAMPDWLTYGRWRMTQPEFAEEVHRLNLLKEEARLAKIRARRWPFDQALADKIMARLAGGEPLEVLDKAPDLPSMTVVRCWRRENRQFREDMALHLRIHERRFRARPRAPRKRTPEMMAAVLDAVRQGESLLSFARRPGAPNHQTLYVWVRKFPDFAREIELAYRDREDWFTDQVMIAADADIPEKERQRRIAAIKARMSKLGARPGAKAKARARARA